MRLVAAALALAGILLAPATCRAADGAPQVPAALAAACRSAIEDAARRHGVPASLLAAIGQVESSNHPFALNIGGRAYFPESYREAELLAAQGLRARRSVDIGCMQINISRHHRRAFSSLLHALHPAWNADYGARFVRELFERHGSWEAAAANYHSSRRDAQIRYVTEIGRRISAINAPGAQAARRPAQTAVPDAIDPRAVRLAEAASGPLVLHRRDAQ